MTAAPNNFFLQTLWQMALTIIYATNDIWKWLLSPVKVYITYIKIPIILPDGIFFELPFSPLDLAGAAIIVLIGLWVVKNLVPIG